MSDKNRKLTDKELYILVKESLKKIVDLAAKTHKRNLEILEELNMIEGKKNTKISDSFDMSDRNETSATIIVKKLAYEFGDAKIIIDQFGKEKTLFRKTFPDKIFEQIKEGSIIKITITS